MARSKEFEKEEILDKAVELFSTKGYNGISMQEIVDGLDLNRSSIYDTFGDKRNLFIAALKHYKQKSSKQMQAKIDASTDIKKTLVDIFNVIISESYTEAPQIGCFIVNASIELAQHEKEVSNIAYDNSQVIQGALEKAIKKAQFNKQISSGQSPRALAKFFMNTFNGMRVSARAGSDRKSLEEIAKIAISVLDAK
jgi:TetR/AcrR family transcriptional repressor of nem operon